MADLRELPNNAYLTRGNPTVGDSAVPGSTQLGGYAPEYSTKYPSNQHQANTTLTLATGKSLTSSQLGYVFHMFEDEWAAGWWFNAMPRRVTTELNHEWKVLTTPFTSFDMTPEGVGPRYVQEEQSRRAASLQHFSQGSMVKAEFFMTDEGKAMFERSKRSVAFNAVRHQKNMVAINIFASPDVWREYRKEYGTAYASLYDFIADGKRLFGVFNRDPKAIYKLHAEMEEWTAGYTNPPNLNMSVAARGSKMLILHGEPDGKPNPHSESYRFSESSTEATLKNSFAPITTRVGIPVFEDQPVADSKHQGIFDPFERIVEVGAYAILQNDEFGPANTVGRREPQCQLITLPADKWRTFGFREMLGKCARFNKDGGLDRMRHQKFINDIPDLASQYDHDAEHPDPFVYAVEEGVVGPRGRKKVFAVADIWGAQDTHWRDVDYDVRQAMDAAKATLTEEDDALLDRFMKAVQGVYELPAQVPVGFAANIAGANVQEPTWGGMNADLEDDWKAPWGRGTIANMVSYLKTHNTAAARPDEWEYKDLIYEAVDAVLRKLYRALITTYAGMVYNNAIYCPIQHITGDKDTDAMNAVLANCLEPHAKYPVFALGAGEAARDMDGWGAYDLFATPNLMAQKGNVDALADKFAENVKDLKINGNKVETLQGLADVFADKEKRTNVFSGLVGYLQTSDLSDWREGGITEAQVNLWSEQKALRAPGVERTGVTTYTMRRASISGKAFGGGKLRGDGVELVPANPLNPSERLRPNEDDDGTFYPQARAQFGAVSGPNPTYHQRERVLVGSEAANVVGGPFLSFDINGTKIVDRRFMLERLEHVAEMTSFTAAAFARAFLATPVSRQSCESMVDKMVPPPINLMLANPFIRMRSSAYLICEGGSDLGEFLYSFMNSMIGASTHHKVWEFNYTLWMGAFVKDETKIIIKPDARICGYESGLSDKFFESERDYMPQSNNKSLAEFPSMFVFDLPVNCGREEMTEKSNPAFLMGKPDTAFFGANISNKKMLMNPRKQTFASWGYYNTVFGGFARINLHRQWSDHTYLTLKANKNSPGIMLPRATRSWNGRKWKRIHDGNSHLDLFGEPPLRPTLDGKITYGTQRPFGNAD